MTGPEHYRQAEKLIRMADRIADSGGDEGSTLAPAQVHATLALAAATALTPGGPGTATRNEWVKAEMS